MRSLRPTLRRILAMSAAGWVLASAVLCAQSGQPQTSIYSRPAQASYVTEQPAEALAIPAAAPAPLRLAPRKSNPAKALGPAAAPAAGGAIGTVVGSLAIVLGLFVVLVWCSKRFSPAGSAMLPKEAIEMLGRASLTPRQQEQLVRVGNKLLVVAISTTGVETLTEITDPVEVERLAALCRRQQPASASSSFSQILGQISREPARPGFVEETRPRTRGAA